MTVVLMWCESRSRILPVRKRSSVRDSSWLSWMRPTWWHRPPKTPCVEVNNPFLRTSNALLMVVPYYMLTSITFNHSRLSDSCGKVHKKCAILHYLQLREQDYSCATVKVYAFQIWTFGAEPGRLETRPHHPERRVCSFLYSSDKDLWKFSNSARLQYLTKLLSINNHCLCNDSVKITDEGRKALLQLSKGDMRRALNILQACHAGYEVVDEDAVYNCTGNPHPADIETIVNSMLTEDFTTAYSSTFSFPQLFFVRCYLIR